MGRLVVVGLTLLATGCSATVRSTDAAAPVPTVTSTVIQPTTSAVAPDRADGAATTATPAGVAPTSSTSSTSSTSTTSTTSEPVWPRTITMAFTGDTLPHSPLWRRAAENAAAAGREGHDFGPMLAGLAPIVATVDLGICHLETPIAPEGEEYSTMPFYGVPAGIADAIADAGYDRCSTASNHTADRGVAGIERTVDVLELAGVAQSGMARRPEEIEPSVFEVRGVPISHLSYTWSYNGLSLPAGDEWRSALIDPERIVADAARARDLGAAIVIVSLHWGAEGVHEPTRFQRDVADELTASGLVDLIVGHHAHVVQPIEQVNDTWVLFGLGNILSNLPTSDRWPAASQDAMVVTVSFEVDEDGAVTVGRPSVAPTWVDKDAGWIVRLVDEELARDDLGAGQRGRLEASLARTADVVGEYLRTA